MALFEQWEYMTKFVWANIDREGAKDYLQRTWPKWQNPPKYTPEAMIPELNDWGKYGWELVHMEPIPSPGKNYDIGYALGGTGGVDWSNVYFCVFKRRITVEV